ncbi:unnamed protein product [Prorocentrum cordatum]|uniref:FACT complex subunit n=1 Tax=Prorocentrum cordatum TaxID=2364126 RepID=A0ABN9W856_9DINO|nr:unnamed protein product [Polarella glacialis]
MGPCAFLLREPVEKEIAHLVAGDRVSVIPCAAGPTSSQLRGEPGALCGILGVHVDDQVNGGRGLLRASAMERAQGGCVIGATDPSLATGPLATWCPMAWKSQKTKQGCASTLAGESRLLKASLGHLEWIMCAFAATLYPMFCLENRDTYSKKFSATSVIYCKSVFDRVTKPGGPTGLDDKKASIDIAIAKGGRRRLGRTLRQSVPQAVREFPIHLQAWAMAKFEVRGRDDQASAFMLGMADVHPEESTTEMAQARVKVRVPATELMAGTPAKKGNVRVTLQYVSIAGNVQVMTTAALEDEVRETLVKLEKMYVEWQDAPVDSKPKMESMCPAVELFRAKTEMPVKKQLQKEKGSRRGVPMDDGCAEAMDTIMESVAWSLVSYSIMRDRVLEALKEFLPEENQAPEVDGPWDPGSDWTMSGETKSPVQ